MEVSGQLHTPGNHRIAGSADSFYRNSVRGINWIDASNSSGFLTVFFLICWKFPAQSSSPSSQSRVLRCVTAVSRPCRTSARSRWPISTAIDNYRPALTGFLPLNGGSTASVCVATVDTVLLFTSLFISLAFILFVSAFLAYFPS